MATKAELLEKLKNGVVEYEEDEVKEAAQQALDDGYDALEMIMSEFREQIALVEPSLELNF